MVEPLAREVCVFVPDDLTSRSSVTCQGSLVTVTTLAATERELGKLDEKDAAEG